MPAADGVHDIIEILRGSWDGRRHRKIFFEALDLVAGNVYEAGAVAAQIKAGDETHHFAPLVADGESVLEDGEVRGQGWDRQQREYQRQCEFSGSEHF